MAVQDGKLAAAATMQAKRLRAKTRRSQPDGRSHHQLRRHPFAQSVLAGLRAAGQFGAQVHKAFEAGWGGAVWKTIGAPVLNVSNRYGAWHYGGQRMLAINNVELISDRPLETNLREIAEVKRAWPDRAVIVSAMVESKPEAWQTIIRQIEDTGADGIELELWLPARHERARHGRRRGPGAGILRADHCAGSWKCAQDSRHRQA